MSICLDFLLVDRLTPRSTREVRAFNELVLYYRIFIRDFSIIAAVIYDLLRKGHIFKWTAERQAAMDNLKCALSMAPVLVSLDFSPLALLIVLP